ncbi:PH domain-containing protein [Aestuariimicrobium ganziense]|uniref:PH domain-containing protein n=1 Tax=Aestuariimicrobium ganziense TaxID=2773677 RepID=UPI00194497F5|nr:PH domain-containing protein [Aestuariimicrobium ganziense]
MDELFAPPTEQWRRLSPRYASMKRVSVLIGWGIFALIVMTPLVVWAPWWVSVAVGVALLVLVAWRYVRQGRLAASWGYAERDDELYVTHGLWFRHLSIVPYGRMQVVEVSSGPVMRHFGLARVQLVTASASTDASIPGLTADDAIALRDRLTERAQHRQAGL